MGYILIFAELQRAKSDINSTPPLSMWFIRMLGCNYEQMTKDKKSFRYFLVVFLLPYVLTALVKILRTLWSM